MFRVPSQNDRGKWIEAIEKHQSFDHYRKIFHVCIRHFHANDVNKKGEKIVLKPNVIPSIFRFDMVQSITEGAAEEIDPVNSTDRACNNEAECSGCSSREAKIVQLTKRINEINAEHSLSTNKFERNISKLQKNRDEKTEKLLNTNKLLVNKTKENLKLKDVISTLQRKKFITSHDADILNVRKFQCYCLTILLSDFSDIKLAKLTA